MSGDGFDYPVMVSHALRDVVRQVLEVVADGGLPGGRPIFISFVTTAPGVLIPETLLESYPEEMTIVFEHQFWDLEVDRDRFGVDMVFQGARHRLEIPLTAVTAFNDPSVPFGLRFDLPTAPEEVSEEPQTAAEDGPATETEPLADNVIRFDRPRNS